MATRRTTTRITVEHERGVFMISVAAELAEMHPQTLRMYEQRGLITPQRSPKGTRLYSQADVERLRRIQEMTTELGLNLAGVERVLELEEQLERTRNKLERLEAESAAAHAELEEELRRAADRLLPARRVTTTTAVSPTSVAEATTTIPGTTSAVSPTSVAGVTTTQVADVQPETQHAFEAGVQQAAQTIIAELGATSIKDMGKVMAAMKERYAGQMDFARASAVIKTALSSPK